MKFSIISCGWNCERYVEDWRKSLLKQNVDWEAFVVNDGSTDKTKILLDRIKDPRIHVFHSEKCMGAAFSRWRILQKASHNSIIVQLDLDDWLTDNALSKVLPHYEAGKKMTVGSFSVTKGSFRPPAFYSKEQIDKNTFPLDKVFKCPPLRTFHGSLLPVLRQSHFKLEGKWLRACTDVALMWPILWELSYEDIVFLKDTLYVYRRRMRTNTSGGRVQKGPILQKLRNTYVF